MTRNINAVFLDLGDTLRFVEKDQEHMARARRKITEMVGTDEDPLKFYEKLNVRYKEYRRWAFEHLAEAPEAEIWCRWLAPDFPAEKIAPLGVELTYHFRQANGRRVVVDGGREVLEELQNRGYRLGIISNLISSSEIPEWLEKEDYARYFSSVILSSVTGRRKPDPVMYHEAARRAGTVPEACAYVGDNLARDVTGARAAGFSMVVIFNTPEVIASAEVTDENRPDSIIHSFRQLLDIFPPLPGHTGKEIKKG